MLDYPVVYLGKDRYKWPLIEGLTSANVGYMLLSDSILDLLFLLLNASACHFMDSSISCFTDLLLSTNKLYMHTYMTHVTGEPHGAIYSKDKWTYVA